MAVKTSRESKKAIRPLGDRVLIQPLESKGEAKTASGIIVPGKEQNEGHERGIIIASGPGRLNGEGKRVPMDVAVGDTVWFKRGYDAEEVKVDDHEMILTSEGNVLAIEG